MNNFNNDDIRTVALYQSLFDKHDHSFQSLGWGSQASQIKRFKVLTEIGVTTGDSILDVGCGLSDFYAWLSRAIDINYTGLDITPAMISASRIRFPLNAYSNGTIFKNDMDPTQDFDYLLASGLFFYRLDEPFNYMKDTIVKMYSLCKKGIAFNTLSLWSDMQSPNEFYADPTLVLEFCRSLTSSIVLRHDYHSGDFTVYLYRKKTS